MLDIINPRNFKLLDDIYLCAKLAISFASNSSITANDIKTFKLRCLDFYIEGAKQIKTRYKFDDPIAIKLEFLDQDVVQSRKISSLVETAVLFPSLLNFEDVQALDTEWRNLRNNTSLHSPNAMALEEYWKQIITATNPVDEKLLYPTLGTFVSGLMCLPHSSAAVERSFSSINLMKTSLNRDN